MGWSARATGHPLFVSTLALLGYDAGQRLNDFNLGISPQILLGKQMWMPEKEQLEEWDEESNPDAYTNLQVGLILGGIGFVGVLGFWVYPLYCAFCGNPWVYFFEELAFGSLALFLLGVASPFNFQLINKVTQISVFDLLRIGILSAVMMSIYWAYGRLVNSFDNVQCDALPREMFPPWF